MKLKIAVFSMILIFGLISSEALAFVKKSVSYKIAVIIPADVQVKNSKNLSKAGNNPLIKGPQNQFFIEESIRNNQPVILKTAVVK